MIATLKITMSKWQHCKQVVQNIRRLNCCWSPAQNYCPGPYVDQCLWLWAWWNMHFMAVQVAVL